jgi:hypothetical protein
MSKRLLAASVSAAALLFASAAFASGVGNEAYVDQMGDGNTFAGTQTGNYNNVANASTHASQDSSAGIGGNTLTTNQTGNYNSIGVNWYGTGLPVVQSGNSNTATITQTGSGAGADGHNALRELFQYGPGNSLNLSQNGDNNLVASTYQYGLYGGGQNSATIVQSGNNNGWSLTLARTPQFVLSDTYGFAKTWGGNSALNQTGLWNYANLQFTGNGNGFDVAQWGSNNSATQVTTAAGSDNNYFGLSQTGSHQTVSNSVAGDGNVLLAKQGDQASYYTSQYNTVSWSQSGNGNWAESLQLGSNNLLQGYQIGGDSNQTYSSQIGDRNTVSAYQNGTGNLFTVNQGVTGSPGNDNVAYAAQTGSNNIGLANQNGSNNHFTLTQH